MERSQKLVYRYPEHGQQKWGNHATVLAYHRQGSPRWNQGKGPAFEEPAPSNVIPPESLSRAAEAGWL